MIDIGRDMMEQVLGAMKNEKVSASVFGLLLFISVYAFSWANRQHELVADASVKSEQYNHDQEELKKQLGQLTDAVTEYIDDAKIVDASQLIRDKQLALQIAHATSEPESEIKRITAQINQAKSYRTCLINRRPNCKHLKPPE